MTKGEAEFPQKTFRNAYTLLVIFLSFAIASSGNYVYTNHVQEKSDHQWCELLASLAVPLDPHTVPPPTERSLKINGQLIRLAHSKGCI